MNTYSNMNVSEQIFFKHLNDDFEFFSHQEITSQSA